MNQYIITEERAQNIVNAIRNQSDEGVTAYQNGFDEGFEIGKAQCETHHEELLKSERDKVLDDFACWIKTEWVQESIKDYKADKPCK
jgi:hypothetical protein